MQIVDFTHEHIQEAAALALDNYNEERSHVFALPKIDNVPDLTPFADNGLGVAAFENNKLVGFLCSYPHFDNAFRSTDVRGVFSPMGSNGAIRENRSKIYATMYQEVAKKWVEVGAVSHAICLYAHDEHLQRQFYLYSFGLRCMDSIRLIEPINCIPCDGYGFYELSKNKFYQIYSLDTKLNKHYKESPFFMNRKHYTEESFVRQSEIDNIRYFSAIMKNEIFAYIAIGSEGETFISNDDKYAHITGAYCLPEHRGKGLMQNLLNFTISTLKVEGYTHLGVDFESINPTAYGFWLKYFTAYTHSGVRRIDENILDVDR